MHADRGMRGMRGCCSYVPFVSIVGLVLLLAGLALYGHEVSPTPAPTIWRPNPAPSGRPCVSKPAVWSLLGGLYCGALGCILSDICILHESLMLTAKH